MYGEVDPHLYEIYDDLEWGSVSSTQFFKVLDAAVQRLANDYDTIAISFSGGIDSAYCLYRLYRVCGPERVIPVYFDAPTDGHSNYLDVVRRTVAILAPECRLEEVSDDSAGYRNQARPSLHAVPAAAASIERRAHAQGAQVLVTGCGADEIITPPKYLGLNFITGLKVEKTIARFTQAISIGLGAVLEEYVAPALFAPSRLSPSRRFQFAFEELHCAPPYDLLDEPFRSHCEVWTNRLYEAIREKCLRQASTLAEIDAFLSVFPLSRLRRVTDCLLDVRHPFQDPDVVRCGLQVPFADKLGSVREPVYQRRKTLLYRQMPIEFQRCVPSEKVGYSAYLQATCRYQKSDHRRLQDLRFLHPYASFESLDLSTKLILDSIARWLDAAGPQGYSPTSSEGK